MQIPNPSKYPKQLYLRGEAYKLVFIKNLPHLGETDADKKIIRIRAGMSNNETFRTVLHEVLHFIEFEWPINIPHKMVYKLEKAIFQLLLDNFFSNR